MLDSMEKIVTTPTQLRRAVTVVLACAPFSPQFVGAQSGKKVFRVGVLWLGEPSVGVMKPFLDELQKNGLRENSNLLIESRSASSSSLLGAAAIELVALKPDVIFVQSGTVATMAVAKATAQIPIVFLLSNDPVARGVVASLSHPGGNITGNFTFSRQLDLKRFQLLSQVTGDDVPIGVLDIQIPSPLMEAYKQTAAGRARRIHFFDVTKSSDFATSFEKFVAEGVRGVAINSFPLATTHKSDIGALTVKYRMPAVADGREFAQNGGLLAYSMDWDELAISAARMVYRILSGTKPSEIALSQPTRYEFIVNLRAAKALGVAVPEALLARADQIIG